MPESPSSSQSSHFSWSSGMPSVKNSLTVWTMLPYELDDDSTFEETSSGRFTFHLHELELARASSTTSSNRICYIWLLIAIVVALVIGTIVAVCILFLSRQVDVPDVPTGATEIVNTTTISLVNLCSSSMVISYNHDNQLNQTNLLVPNASIAFTPIVQATILVGQEPNTTAISWKQSNATSMYMLTVADGPAIRTISNSSSCSTQHCSSDVCALSCPVESDGLMGEAFVRVVLFCGIFTVQCCITVLGTITRDTIFLRVYDSRYVSHMTVLMSFASAYAMTLASSLVQRGMRSSIVACGFPMLSAIVMIALWIVLERLPDLLYISSVGLYVWIEIAIQLLSQQFWDLCASAFTVAESKQYFGVITFGSTLGTILASFCIIPLLQTYAIPTEGNVLVLALIQGGLGAFMALVTPTFGAQTRSKPATKEPLTPASSIVSDIQNRSYLKHVCFFDMGATLIRVLVDYRTLSILSQHSEETLKYSLGAINGAQSFLMIPLQMASGPIFSYLGVMYGISTLPIAIIAFGATTYASSSPLLLIGTRALYNSVSHAIFNPARELLWLPLNASDRTKYKSFVIGPFRSIARILGAVISIILTSDFMKKYCGSSSVSAVMVVFGIAWFFDALAARQSYAAEFYSSLKKGHMDLTSPLIDFTTDQIDLVRDTLRCGAANQITFVLSFLRPSHVSLFRNELREVFYRPDLVSFHSQLRLVELHVAAQQQQQTSSVKAPPIFTFNDLLAVYQDSSVAMELRLACLLACGYEHGADPAPIVQALEEESDVSFKVGAAIALLRLTQWMDEKATVILQKLLHEPRDIASKVICLRIVGKELPELLGNGYIVYLLHQTQDQQIVRAALECCRQSKRASPMLLPALLKWLPDATFRMEAIDAMQYFAPSILWDHVVNFLDKAVESVEIEHIAGGIRLVEAAAFPSDAKLDLLMSMMDSLVANKDNRELQLSELLLLSQVQLPIWETLADALLRIVDCLRQDDTTDIVVIVKRMDQIVATHVFCGYQMRQLRTLFEDPNNHTLLSQVIEDTLDMLLRIVLKLISARFPRGFNIHVLIEGLHSDVPEVISAVQEVLETLLPASTKYSLLPLLFPSASKAPIALQLIKEAANLQNTSQTNILMNTMQNSSIPVELSCLALEYYLHAISCRDHDDIEETARILTEAQAKRLLAHPITKDLVSRAFRDPQCRRAKALEHLFQESDMDIDSATPTYTTFDVVMSLKTCALFHSITVMELVQKIARHFKPSHVPTSTTFVREGDIASEMFVVAKGQVELHQSNGNVITTLGSGACVGELALLTSKGTHLSSATALTDCVLLAISRSELHKLIHTSGGIARGVLDAMASTLRWTYLQMETNEETSRLKRLVFASQVVVAANVDRAASSFLAKIGRHRSKSAHLPGTTKHPHLLDFASLKVNAESFTPRPQEEIQYSHLEKCLHLKASHLMKDVDDELISTVAQMAQVAILNPRDVLFAEGSPARNIYVVIEGTVVLTSNKDDKKQYKHFPTNSCFGELSFMRGATNIMSATAMTNQAVVLQIPTWDFVELAEKHTNLMHLIMTWLSKKITSKMNDDSTHLPLRTAAISPIGSPRGSPRKRLWSDDEDSVAMEATSGLRLRQNTL